jgi:hypothetical protein
VVRSNDPDEPVVVIPVHVDALPAPDLVVRADTVRFPGTAVGDTSEYDLWVGNIGTVDLEVTGVASSAEDFTVAPQAFAIPPGDFVTLTISFAPASAGEHDGVVTLVTNDPDEGHKQIAVGGEASTGDSVAVVGRPVAVESESHTHLLTRTSLHPNVPNPFNPTTTIAYDLHVASAVAIVVYDVRGRVVRTLVDDVKPPGRYTIVWDGSNDSGAPVATGIYFCRMAASDFAQIRKLVLLK